ncbi:MAG: T9SS C-terminal target domain-containing protein, partial [Bacteroidetes bacterium]
HIIYPHGSGQSPNPQGSGADNWFKIYMNELNTWSWITQTSDNDAHFIYARFDNPGVYTLQISGRSNGYAIDRMVLFNESVDEAMATSLSQAETTCDPGGSGNTPPVFSLSGDVNVVENFTTTELVTVTPDPVPADEQDQVVTYSLSPASVPFANVSINPQTGTVTITSVPNQFGSQVFVVTADDGQDQNNTYSQTFTLSVLSEAAANAVIRINAGGPAYTANGGLEYVADVHYNAGRPYEVSTPISGTEDDLLYQSERTHSGTLSYNIPVPNGNYLVRLHFAEIYHNQNGGRVFSIDLEGARVKTDYDIVAEAGPFAAQVLEYPALVADGSLDIDLYASIDQPKISAIEVLRDEPATPNTPPTFSLSGDVVVDEDFVGTQTVSVTPDPVPAEEADQVVTYSLSPASVPFANIDFDPATGEVNITAIADAHGSQEFVITADDGQPNDNLASQSFMLRVNAVNDAPVFVLSGDVTVNEDFEQPQTVRVTPGTVPENELNQPVTYSLEPASVDFAHIAFDASTGEVNISAVENGNGSQVFSITADDGQAANNLFTQEFTLTVNPVNDAPDFHLSTNSLTLLENFSTTEVVSVTAAPVPADEANQAVLYSLEPASVSFANIAFDEQSGQITITSVPNQVGAQVFTITADDGQNHNNLVSRFFTLTVINEPETGYEAHINAAGPAYTSLGGVPFMADAYFSGGEVLASTVEIAGTDDDPLYQQVRAGSNFSYAIPLYFGNYTIRLHLADIDSSSNANRFNLLLEDIPVINGLDLAAEVGKASVLIREYNLTITDGELNLDFEAIEGLAQVAAIEVVLTSAPENSPPFFSLSGDVIVEENFSETQVVTVTPHPVPPAEQNQRVTYSLMPAMVTFAEVSFDPATGRVEFNSIFGETGSQVFTITADDGQAVNNTVSESFLLQVLPAVPDTLPDPDGMVRINAGGASYLASSGNTFAADIYFNGGEIHTTGAAITGTDDPTLFQSSRTGLDGFTYDIPLYFGNYNITLYFAETQALGSNERVFDVNMEGYTLLRDFDIFREAGDHAALTKTFNLTVSDGSLNIELLPVIGAPTISAIEIELAAEPENRPPFFTLSGDVRVGENFSETQYVTATPLPVHPDEASQVVTYSLSPASVDFALVSIDPATGLVSINSLPNASGSQVFVVTADDGQAVNNTVSETFTLTVEPGSGGGGPTLTSLRINSGSNQDLIFGGHTFVADVHYSNNYSWTNTSAPAIANTPYDALFHSERAASTDLGSFSYHVPVENGTYQVFLHFAEIYWGATGGSPNGGIGTRVFNVDIEGVPSLVNFDIIEEVGSMAASSHQFEVTVTDGVLDLDFYASANRPKVSAIEILPPDQAHTSIINVAGNHQTVFDPAFEPQKDESKDKLIVAPNPAGGQASLLFESARAGTFELMIYDAWGRLYQKRLIRKEDHFEAYQLSLEALPAGLYAVQVVQNGYSIATKLWRTGR